MYYHQYFFPENICNGIDWIADYEHATKKATAEMLMTRGLRVYMGEKVQEQIALDDEARALNQQRKITHFTRKLHRLAKSKDMNMNQFLWMAPLLPPIAAALIALPPALGNLPAGQVHLDLMHPLRRLGYPGGLKSIEAQLGIGRGGVLRQVDGFLAVILWREYKRGNKAALDALIRYNLEDVVNLQYLADKVYNKNVVSLPVSVCPLPEPEKYCLDDMPFDEDLVEYLLRQVQERWW
jgi:hypothetical protein